MKEFIRKNIIVIILSLLIIIMAIAFLYEMYYMGKQSETLVIPEEYFYIKDVESSDIDIVAKTWVSEYVLQYMQKYLNRNKKIEEFNITSIEVLDKEANQVSVKFTIKPKVVSSSTFGDWGYCNEDGVYECEWIITLETTYKNNGYIWYVTQRISRASYELAEFNLSGKAQLDEKYYQFMDKKKYEDLKKDCTYKIENGELYFTYDHSNSWIKIAISGFEDMLDEKSYELDENFYRIKNDMTYIYYNGKVAISKDAAKTFSVIDCSEYKNVMYVYFKDENTGYIVSAADFAMGRYAPVLYKTTNAGKSFEEIKLYESISWVRRECKYYAFNEDLVYVMDPTADGTSSALMVSTDGFKTFKNISLPEGTFTNELDNESLIFFDIYDTYEIPEYENGKYILVLNQGSDGDYNGGTKAAYESEDGINWIFIEEFKQTSEPWEG